jgi:hypothetical protein
MPRKVAFLGIAGYPRFWDISLDGSKAFPLMVVRRPRNARLGKGYVSCTDGDERIDAEQQSYHVGQGGFTQKQVLCERMLTPGVGLGDVPLIACFT